MPDKESAIALNRKIKVAIADEDRIWRSLRKALRLDRSQIYFVGDLVKRYMDQYVATYNIDIRHKSSRLATFASFMGAVSVDKINISAVSRFLAMIKQSGRSNATVNRYREIIAHMIRWATDQGIFEINPLIKLQKLDEPEYCTARPDERTIDAVFNEIDSKVRPIFCFLRETGCRKGEAISLKPEQIDYSRQVVTFHTSSRLGTRTKSGKIREVPLFPDALTAIQTALTYNQTAVSNVFYRHFEGCVEPWRDRTLDRFWELARNRAAIVNPIIAENCRTLRIHDLRHAYAIDLAEAGCPMHFISKVLGHHSVAFTEKRYARFSPNSAAQGVRMALENGTKRAPRKMIMQQRLLWAQ